MPRLRLLAAVAVLAAGCGGGTPDAAEGDAQLGPPALVEDLRGGGYVLYLRHTHTDMSRKDTQKSDVSTCEGMRNLTARGRSEARALGRALRDLDVPVGEVRSSAYCRTRETADLAFGRYVRDETLTGFPDPGDADHGARVQATRALLARRPPDGGNTVLVAHVKNLEAAADLTIDEGDVAVFEPRGTSFRYRGRIPASAWPQLAARLRRGP
ncbi:MAG TPA: histidine phosphatase family protein [Gaiellaceae bacterium]|nr:histidine phosphatase family protein [Gaiellaceae bacterium]